MTSDQISTNLISAIEQIAGNMDSSSSGAMIIDATVTKKLSNGKYQVSYQDATFSVTSAVSSANFKVGATVTVLIPEGDYSKDKIIISPFDNVYSSDEDDQYIIDASMITSLFN